MPGLGPGLQGPYPWKRGTENSPDGPEGAGGTGRPEAPIIDTHSP